MTAGTAAAPRRPLGDFSRGFRFHPAEGWLTLIATALMAVVFAGSLADARWVGDDARNDTTYLVWLALVGVAFGFGGAKVGWGRWRTILVGATFAGLILPLILGGIMLGPGVGLDPHGLAERYAAAYGVAQHVWTDLAVLNRPYTLEYGHYHLIFGGLVWGAGLLAGYTVFGHRRPLDAVVVLGLAMLANMALTQHNQLTLLVLFSAAALLLLIRTHVFEEELTWARRKIGDPSAVGQLYLRGGAAFVTVAVIGSILLTFTASSAPLQDLWKDLPSKLQAISQWVQKIAPPGGAPRGIGSVSFGRDGVTQGYWQPSGGTAFVAQIPPSEPRDWKWRLGTYADYTGFGWTWGQTRNLPTAARDILLTDEADAPNPVGRREVPFIRITPDAFRDPTILSPNTVLRVDQPTNALVVGNDGWFTTVESGGSLDSYQVSALIPVFLDVPGGITQARLRAAGTDYPAELKTIYTGLPEGVPVLGPAATALLDDVRAAVPSTLDPTNPFDLATAMEKYLKSDSNFVYDADVRDERQAQCAEVSSVECFAIIRRGYCEYYASTMAVLLRASNIPARVVYGFLQGARGTDGREVIPASAAHQWVEVYFPGTGWVEFDPTGGGIGRSAPIPSGSVGPSVGPRSSQPAATFREPTVPPGGPGATGGGRSNGGIGPFIVIALILAIGVGALMFAAYRRTPNRPMHPDQAWGSVARLAARFGLGPKPSQTVYEYAGALGDAVPDARPELTTIARAKVEVVYGRRDLEPDRLKRIAQAYHRLRFALLSLFLRRTFRRRGRKT